MVWYITEPFLHPPIKRSKCSYLVRRKKALTPLLMLYILHLGTSLCPLVQEVGLSITQVPAHATFSAKLYYFLSLCLFSELISVFSWHIIINFISIFVTQFINNCWSIKEKTMSNAYVINPASGMQSKQYILKK